MKTHFYVHHWGNKIREMDEIYKYFVHNGIDTIIEPFCGTSSFSYYISLKHPNKFKYILNDNSENLYKLYNTIKDNNKRKELNDSLNKDISNIKNKDDYLKLEGFNRWYIHNKYYKIRPGLYPTDKRIKNIDLDKIPMTNFLLNENVEIYNNDALDIIKKYINDDKCFIFLDPPYINSEISFYCKPSLSIYDYFKNNNINNFKAYIMLVLENIDIIVDIFNDNIISTYNKNYKNHVYKTEHIIITNYFS